MNEARLRQILEAYGGDPGQWPVDERVPALALLETSPDLQALQRSEQALDLALDAWPETRPSAALVGAVLPHPVAVAASPLDRLLRQAAQWLGRPAAAMAMASAIAIAGVLTGYAFPETTQTTSAGDLLASEVNELILPSAEWASLQ